jgi:hypothetical protein
VYDYVVHVLVRTSKKYVPATRTWRVARTYEVVGSEPRVTYVGDDAELANQGTFVLHQQGSLFAVSLLAVDL